MNDDGLENKEFFMDSVINLATYRNLNTAQLFSTLTYIIIQNCIAHKLNREDFDILLNIMKIQFDKMMDEHKYRKIR